MLAISLALGSSVCYGVSNFLGPQLAREHALVTVLVVSQLAALLGCAVYLVVDGGAALPGPDVLLALLAGMGNAFGLIGFYKAAELGPLSVAAPIGATGAVLPVVYGLASGDVLEATQVAGLVLAMGGAALAARQTSGIAGVPPSDSAGKAYPNPRASVVWAASSAIAFGIFLTALPKASAHGQAWAIFDARVALVAVFAVWAGRRLKDIRFERRTPRLAFPGLLLLLGTVLYTTAADHGPLSLVSVLGSLFPVVTVGLGMGVLGERLSRVQATGVAAALAGIVLISL